MQNTVCFVNPCIGDSKGSWCLITGSSDQCIGFCEWFDHVVGLTSGAKYSGVPQKVFIVAPSVMPSLHKPKSVIFMWPSLSSIRFSSCERQRQKRESKYFSCAVITWSSNKSCFFSIESNSDCKNFIISIKGISKRPWVKPTSSKRLQSHHLIRKEINEHIK